MIAKRIEVIEGERPAQADEQPHDVDMNNSFEDDLGPNFDDMGDLPNVAAPENVHGTAVEQVSRAIDKYTQHAKGYVTYRFNYFQPVFGI